MDASASSSGHRPVDGRAIRLIERRRSLAPHPVDLAVEGKVRRRPQQRLRQRPQRVDGDARFGRVRRVLVFRVV
jgi:hypothetical protein